MELDIPLHETISRSLGCSRNTVKKYVRLAEQRGLDPAALTGMEDHELEKLFSDPAPITRYSEESTPVFRGKVLCVGIVAYYGAEYPITVQRSL